MEKIIIRKAETKDLADIFRLNLDLFKKEHKEYDDKLNLNWTYGKVGKGYFKKRIFEKDGFVVVAENDGKIVGYLCGGIKTRPFDYRKIKKYASLENTVVDKKFRNHGIGKKMAGEFLKWCQEKKADCVSVDVKAKNEKAKRFYRKLGFKDYNLFLEIKN